MVRFLLRLAPFLKSVLVAVAAFAALAGFEPSAIAAGFLLCAVWIFELRVTVDHLTRRIDFLGARTTPTAQPLRPTPDSSSILPFPR